MKAASLIFLVPAFVLAYGTDDQAKLKAAHEDAKECCKAVEKEDYEKLANLTYIKVIEKFGPDKMGREKMIQKIRETMTDMRAQGLKMSSSKVKAAPTELFKADKILLTIIETTTVLTVKDKENAVKVHSYLVGVSSNDGKNWTFIDGAAGKKGIEEMLPNLPKEMKEKLPETKVEKS